MNASKLQAWFEARWYGGLRPNLGLRLLAALFADLVRARRAAYRLGWLTSWRAPVPVLVVGNLTVGGAGKTPLTIALVDALRARGWRPGVVSRGYGGQARLPTRVTVETQPALVGDEPSLIHARCGVPVAVAGRRCDAARLLLADADVDLLIADDGLQHYALQRDVEVVVIDGQRGFGNGQLLPAGPLREPAFRAAAATFRVINGGGGPDLPSDAWTMRLALATAQPLCGGEPRPLAEFAAGSVQAVAGIGHPERFFSALRGLGIDCVTHAFADHHRFCAADFAFDDGRALLMTEKDAVKCRDFARSNWYAVAAATQIDPAFFDQVDARLRRAKEMLHEPS